MGVVGSCRRIAFVAGMALVCLHLSMGCQQNAPLVATRLLQNQAFIDFSGLKEAEAFDSVKVQAAAPETWDELASKSNPVYTHKQWRSPTHITGVGVAYIHLPVPLPTATLVWFAKQEYSKKANEGKVLGEWVDSIGRTWFEAENKQYHVRGYVVTSGNDAWIIYLGFKRDKGPNAPELALAAKALDTIIPQTGTALQARAAAN